MRQEQTPQSANPSLELGFEPAMQVSPEPQGAESGMYPDGTVTSERARIEANSAELQGHVERYATMKKAARELGTLAAESSVGEVYFDELSGGTQELMDVTAPGVFWSENAIIPGTTPASHANWVADRFNRQADGKKFQSAINDAGNAAWKRHVDGKAVAE